MTECTCPGGTGYRIGVFNGCQFHGDGTFMKPQATVNINIQALDTGKVDLEKLAPHFQMAMAGVKEAALEKLFDDIVAGVSRQSEFVSKWTPYLIKNIYAAAPFWDKANLPVLRWIPPWRWYWNRKANEAMKGVKL